LVGLAHKTVETSMPDRIIKPPIVGVPALAMMWDCGPSARIGWPLPCSARKRSMMDGPNRNTNSSAVMTAPPVRNVM
jgi:hypothetical protein